MGRRTTEQLLAEGRRLREILAVWRAFFEVINPEQSPERPWLDAEVFEIIDQRLDAGRSLSVVVGGIEDCLRDTELILLDRHMAEIHQAWFAFYRGQTGRAYFEDRGDPAKALRIALRRGSIVDEDEFRLLNEIANDVSQTLVKSRDRARLEEMLHRFEFPDGGF